jgi:dihydropteroate synthase
VTVAEELWRVQPVISELRRCTGVLISIDTRKAEVAEKAIELGADVVNDVSGLVSDPRIVPIVAREGAGLVLMHMKGTPEHMQDAPVYRDVVREVKAFLRSAIQRAEAGGVMPDSILVDPGIGFGKTGVHNLQILNRLELFASLEKPILIGTSRKSFIGRVLGIHSPEDRLYGTAATVAASVMRGAHVVRVHDVPEMIQVARSVDAILNEALDRASRSAPIEVSE